MTTTQYMACAWGQLLQKVGDYWPVKRQLPDGHQTGEVHVFGEQKIKIVFLEDEVHVVRTA